MVGRRRRSCIAQGLTLISACITCCVVLEYLLFEDSIEYNLSNNKAAETHRQWTKRAQNSTISTARGTSYDTLLDNPDCPWDALGAPEQVRVAGCNNGECDLITCRRLLKNDTEAMLAAKDFMRRRRRQLLLSDDEVMRMASNCTDFRRRGGYMDKPSRESDADFPIAFNILIHWQLQQFERLLRAIYRPQNTYCIHIDAKTSYSFHTTVLAIARCFDNVFVATKRYRIVYEGFSRLQADIDCMKDHLNYPKAVGWRYLFNVAGQSYPIRTPEEMVDILRIYNGANDIEGLPLHRRLTFRYKKTYMESLDQNMVIPTNKTKPPPPHEIDIVRGSAYGIFSRKFVEFIINDHHAQDLLKWSEDTFSPDEHYYATLHHKYANPQLHAPGGFSGAPESKPFIALRVKWYSLDSCFGKWRHGICILGVGDIPELVTRHEFFINKFALNYEPMAFECTEAWLQQRVLCPAVFDLSFYRNLPFIIH